MTKNTTYDRAVRIAKAISQMIQKDGGTPSHVAAVTVRLPAHTFDQIKRENPRPRDDDKRTIASPFSMWPRAEWSPLNGAMTTSRSSTETVLGSTNR